jgi:hypothetical protein
MGLPIVVLIFGALLLAGEAWLFVHQQKMTELLAFRLLAFTLALIVALVLSVSVVGPDKVAPAFGIVGLVAGYAAGKDAGPR